MQSIAARYMVYLLNHSGSTVAVFDDFESLSFDRKVNDVGQFTLSFVDDEDDRFAHFNNVDYMVSVRRCVPGVGLDWYTEFLGFVRDANRRTEQSGGRFFEASGYDLNHFLARRSIAYRHGTVYSDKNDFAEDVMKEYVDENCGPSANDPSRIRNGVLPGFTVEAESTDHDQTPQWGGSEGGMSLLDTLQKIANFTVGEVPGSRAVDFAVESNGAGSFIFRTFLDQLGTDRTYPGAAVPVIFATNMGNVQNIRFGIDRRSEVNAVIVMGQGEGSTQTIIARENSDAGSESPWNDIETSRPSTQSEFTFQLEDYGDSVLQDSRYRETFDAELLQMPGTLYGLHYFLGDAVTFRYGDVYLDKKIVAVSCRVSNQIGEELNFEFADVV